MQSIGQDTDNSQVTIACDMSVFDGAQRAAHEANAESLLTGARALRETGRGYAFGLLADADTLQRAAQFIANESRCCPFLRFELSLDPDGSQAWLELGGTAHVKAYLQAELLPRLQAARPDLVPVTAER